MNKMQVICKNCGSKRLITKKSFLRNERDGIEKCKNCYNDQDYKTKISIKSNIAWSSESLKNEVRNSSRNWANNNKEILSERSKDLWNNKDYRFNQITKQKITKLKNKDERLKIIKNNFILKSNVVHNNKYDYSKIDYIDAHTKIKIICPIHGEFEQRPTLHISGKECLECSKNKNDFKLSDSSKCVWQNIDYINKQTIVHEHQKIDDNFKIKISESLKKKWQNNEYKNKMKRMFSERSKKLWKNEEYRTKIIKSIESCKGKTSNIEIILGSILNDLNIKYVPQKSVGFFSFDFFLSDYNILIECNGDYWHSLDQAIRNDKAKSNYIINNFSEYKLHYIWEHEFKCKDRIIELIKYWTGTKLDVVDFDFKDLIIKDVELKDARLFVDKYHYSGTIGNSTYRYGCYYNNILIALCSFGNITRNESATRLGVNSYEILELTRLCIHPKYQKKNLASWFISRCVNEIMKLNKYKCLISFADTTYNHDGTIYKASNWKNDGVVPPSYWYVDKDGYVMHKKTLWDHAKKMSITENEYAEKYNYTKIAGKEKIRYVYNL